MEHVVEPTSTVFVACGEPRSAHIGTHICHQEGDQCWPEGYCRWELVVDSQVLADWCAGRAKVPVAHKARITEMLQRLASLIERKAWLPRTLISDWVIWRSRDKNAEAYELVNVAMDRTRSIFYLAPKMHKGMKLDGVSLQAWSDGGHRCQGCSASGLLLKAWHYKWSRPMVLVAIGKFIPEPQVDSMDAEALALELATQAMSTLITSKRLDAEAVMSIMQDMSATQCGADLHQMA
eukprot:350370-Karenia_brevis.AAC.1